VRDWLLCLSDHNWKRIHLLHFSLTLCVTGCLYLLSSTLRGALAACRVCVEANRHNILQSRACCWKARWILHWPAVLSCFPLAFFFFFFSTFRLKTKLSLSPLPSLLPLLPLLLFFCCCSQGFSVSEEGESREEDYLVALSECLCLYVSPLDCWVKGHERKSRKRRRSRRAERARMKSLSCHCVWTLTDHKLRRGGQTRKKLWLGFDWGEGGRR